MLDVFPLRQGRDDRVNQLLCRRRIKFDSNPSTRTHARTDKVDVQRVLQTSINRMIVGHVDLFQLEPSARTLAATRYFRSLDYSSAHLLSPPSRRSKIIFEKREHLLPAVDRRLRTIAYTRVVEEAVPCTGVHVKLVILPILLQLLLQLADALGCRVLVLFSKHAEQWTGQVLLIVAGCDWLCGC